MKHAGAPAWGAMVPWCHGAMVPWCSADTAPIFRWFYPLKTVISAERESVVDVQMFLMELVKAFFESFSIYRKDPSAKRIHIITNRMFS